MFGEGFMVWAKGLGLGLHGSSMAVLAARQFDGAFTIYTCLHACELRARVQLELPWNCRAVTG